MLRIPSLLLAACVLATVAVSATPTASALTCDFSPTTLGGIVGRTYEYATAVADVACDETISYAVYLCFAVLGPHPSCYIR